MTKILITGACGFIGINLVDYILEQTNDLQIVILDRLDVSVHPSRLDHLMNNPRVNFVWWDLRAELNGQVKQQIGDISYIIHLAASSHVNRSIQDPRLFLDDNVVGTMNILNYARSIPNLRRFYHQSTDEVMGPSIDRPFTEDDAMNPTNPYCLHPKTMVLMADGSEKEIQDVNLGDQVMSFDFTNMKTTTDVVTGKTSSYAEYLYPVKVRNSYIYGTKEHKYFVKRPKRWNGGKLDCEYAKLNSIPIQELKAESIQQGDWIATTRKIVHPNITKNIYFDNFPRFLGYFVGDGYIKKSRLKVEGNRQYGRVQKWINLADEKKDFVEFYRDLVVSNVKPWKHSTKNCWYVNIGNKPLVDLLESLPGITEKTKQKYLPQLILDWEDKELSKFIGGWFDADGSIEHHGFSICSYSKKLLRQGRVLLLRLGIYSSISGTKINISDGESVRLFSSIIPSLKLNTYKKPHISNSQITNDGNLVWQPTDSINPIKYQDIVWDLETKQYHNFIVEQDTIVHNSASKASAESIVISFANTYSIPSVIARCVNVYGKYQNVEKFIPLIIKNLHTGKVTKIHCRNSIPGTRYYIHTTHLNEAILYLLFNHELPILTANNRTQGTYNLTTGYSRSNLDLFALIKDHMGISGEFELVEIDKDRPNHDLNYHLDGTKLSKLGFSYSKLDFSESIKDIVIWYLNNKQYLNL